MTNSWRNPELSCSPAWAPRCSPPGGSTAPESATENSNICTQVKEANSGPVYGEVLLHSVYRRSEMQYIVEVWVGDRGLVASMAEMRVWLHHRRIEPNGFRHRSEPARMKFHVDFNHEPDAIGF